MVVVTESYAPHSVGGAEVSLALALGASRYQSEILVVNVLGREACLVRQSVDGIETIALPAQAKWPYHRLSAGERLRIKAELPKPVGWMLSAYHALRYFGSGSPGEIGARALMVLTHALRIRRNGPFAPLDTEQTGYWALALRKILAASGADTVHGDNLLGIMLAERVGGSNLHRIGVVRDNRFLCSRRDQETRIADTPCLDCKAECHEGTRLADRRLRVMARHIGRQRRRALQRLDAVVVTSRYLDRQVQALGRMPPVARIANPAGRRRSGSLGGAAADDPALLPGTNILVVGQINENKGQEAFAALLPQLMRRIPDVQLHFAGRGDPAVERMVALAGAAAGRLHFHGYLDRDALDRLYRKCQIVALPTRWPEPFGRVPLEAGLCQRPVVAYDVGGLAELILHGVTGYVVAAGDAEGFVDALAKLAEDPALRQRLGVAAARHVAQRYDVAIAVDAFETLWEARARRSADARRMVVG